VIFYGTNEENLHLIKNLFPKIKIVARGNAIKAMGEETDISVFGEVLNSLESFCTKYNSLTEEVIVDYIKGKTPAGTSEVDDLIIYGSQRQTHNSPYPFAA
jgi:phosphate starvation-inducible PhoH-like protein